MRGARIWCCPTVEGESPGLPDREGLLPLEDALEVALQVGEGVGTASRDPPPRREAPPTRSHHKRARERQAHRLRAQGRRAGSAAVTESLSVRGSPPGTPGYWPREQALGRLDEIGPPADVYALAALAAAADQAGPRAFTAETLIRSAREHRRPGPASRTTQVPEWLDDLIHACLDQRARPPGPTLRAGPRVAGAAAALRARGVALARRAEGTGPPLAVGCPGRCRVRGRSAGGGRPRARRPRHRERAGGPGSPPATSDAGVASAWVEAGEAKLSAGDYEGALEDFTRALSATCRAPSPTAAWCEASLAYEGGARGFPLRDRARPQLHPVLREPRTVQGAPRPARRGDRGLRPRARSDPSRVLLYSTRGGRKDAPGPARRGDRGLRPCARGEPFLHPRQESKLILFYRVGAHQWRPMRTPLITKSPQCIMNDFYLLF